MTSRLLCLHPTTSRIALQNISPFSLCITVAALDTIRYSKTWNSLNYFLYLPFGLLSCDSVCCTKLLTCQDALHSSLLFALSICFPCQIWHSWVGSSTWIFSPSSSVTSSRYFLVFSGVNHSSFLELYITSIPHDASVRMSTGSPTIRWKKHIEMGRDFHGCHWFDILFFYGKWVSPQRTLQLALKGSCKIQRDYDLCDR